MKKTIELIHPAILAQRERDEWNKKQKEKEDAEWNKLTLDEQTKIIEEKKKHEKEYIKKMWDNYIDGH